MGIRVMVENFMEENGLAETKKAFQWNAQVAFGGCRKVLELKTSRF